MNSTNPLLNIICVEETQECNRECFLGCGKIGNHHCNNEPNILVECDDVC